jgi:hypothetical protein
MHLKLRINETLGRLRMGQIMDLDTRGKTQVLNMVFCKTQSSGFILKVDREQHSTRNVILFRI